MTIFKKLPEPIKDLLRPIKNSIPSPKSISLLRGEMLFSFSEQYRSESDKGEYAAVIRDILKSQKSFENFKRLPAYCVVLEHVDQSTGEAYLNIVRGREDGLIEMAVDSVLVADSVGKPRKYDYNGVPIPLSPTTLRYLKVSSDLLHLFGRSLKHVAEIGCGYGGQCLVNDQLLGYEYATLFDLPIVNRLIRRYLDYTVMNGAYETTTINEKLPIEYDLVISNYAFSELPLSLQRSYIDKVLSKARRGYLTMNSGLGGIFNNGKYSLEQLKELLPPFEVLEEEPSTCEYNYLIVWGHDKSVVDRLFRRKSS